MDRRAFLGTVLASALHRSSWTCKLDVREAVNTQETIKWEYTVLAVAF